MSKNQNDLFEWKSKAQRELNEPSDPKLAIAELRALVEGMKTTLCIYLMILNKCTQ